MRTPLRVAVALTLGLPLGLVAVTPALAANGGGRNKADTVPPSVLVSTPASGSTSSSSLTVSGTASDNKGVTGVAVALDGGTWQPASGTSSWSLALAGLTSGSHSLVARATDTSGNVASTTVGFSVTTTTTSPSPSPSPTATASPSPSPSPTATTSPTPSPTATSTSTSAPNSQGTWVSPEGVTITISSAGSWTISQVYSLLLANARDLSLIGPSLTVNVQDSYASQTTTSASQSGGSYYGYRATVYLKGVSSTFATKPDSQLAHEYGHAWSRYFLYMRHGGSWSSYLTTRWSSSDGSVTLATDSRTGTSYSWDPGEIIAEDYRLLFGSSTAISQAPNSLNTSIVAPSAQPGLRDWFLSTWA